MDAFPHDVERVLTELNDAIAEARHEESTSASPVPLHTDRRRNERRSVVPDRRMEDRRSA
jgi:hypothetical protein